MFRPHLLSQCCSAGAFEYQSYLPVYHINTVNTDFINELQGSTIEQLRMTLEKLNARSADIFSNK